MNEYNIFHQHQYQLFRDFAIHYRNYGSIEVADSSGQWPDIYFNPTVDFFAKTKDLTKRFLLTHFLPSASNDWQPVDVIQDFIATKKIATDKISDLKLHRRFEDYDLWINWCKQVFGYAPDREKMQQLSKLDSVEAVALFLQNRPVAFLMLYFYQSIPGIYFVGTFKEYRNRGFAGYMMKHCINDLIDKGYQQVYCNGNVRSSYIWSKIASGQTGKFYLLQNRGYFSI